MKRITIFILLVALIAGVTSARSVRKKTARGVSAQQEAQSSAPSTDLDIAIYAYCNDDFSTAYDAINRHIQNNPNDAFGWTCLAAIHSELEDEHQALQALAKARSCHIDESDPTMLNWMYFTHSSVHLQAQDTVSAIEDLNMALRYDNTDVDSYLRRGNIFKKMRRFDEAMVDYGMIVQLNPKEVEGYLGIGTISGSLGKRKDAIKAFTKAIELEPDVAECYALRAVEYYNDQDYKKAVKDVISALERDKENARALWVLEYLKLNAMDDVVKEFNDKAKKTKDPSWLEIIE